MVRFEEIYVSVGFRRRSLATYRFPFSSGVANGILQALRLTAKCCSKIGWKQKGGSMSIVKRHLAEGEVRMVLVEEICIDAGALTLDPDTEEVYFSADEDAYREAFVAVFQAWAKGTIKGTAEQVFEATKSVLTS
jgi:hypothetical protein